MKIQKNFTTGILSGICCVLLLFVITGMTTRENTNTTPIYEFYDLETTQGIIFNNVTGEIKYEKIREESLDMREYYSIDLNHSGYISEQLPAEKNFSEFHIQFC